MLHPTYQTAVIGTAGLLPVALSIASVWFVIGGIVHADVTVVAVVAGTLIAFEGFLMARAGIKIATLQMRQVDERRVDDARLVASIKP